MNLGSATSRLKGILNRDGGEEPPPKLDDSITLLMNKKIISVDRKTSAFSAAKVMFKKNIGSLVITEEGVPCGMLTEKDYLRKIVALDMSLKGLEVGEIMSPRITAIGPQNTIHEAMKKAVKHGFRRLPISQDGRLLGIVTETDLARVITGLALFDPIERCMTRDAVTCGGWLDVDKIASLMSSKNIGSIVVMEYGKVSGVVTERDMVKKVLMDEKHVGSELTVEKIMTSPVQTVNPWESVTNAAKIMFDGGFRRLPVTEEGGLVGVVTQTDLIKHTISIDKDKIALRGLEEEKPKPKLKES